MRITALRPPRLRTAQTEAEHRSATWLELFYDLVFVVAVAALGHRLLVQPQGSGPWAFVGLYIPLWWSWASYTFYADRYDTDDLGQRLLAVGQMVSIALMAASISGSEADSLAAFAAAFVFARVILLTMYGRAYRHVAATRELVLGYLKGFSAGGLLWLISIWVPDPWRFVLWGIGLVIDFATPFLMRKAQARVPLSVSHLPERFGLFTILVLGESIAAVVAGLSEFQWAVQPTMRAALGVITASALWWLFFDNHEGSVVRRREGQLKAWRPTAWIYSHLPLAVALTATGIGLEFFVANHPEDGRGVVGWGMAFSLLSMAVIILATERGDDTKDRNQALVRIGGAAAAALIGLIAGAWTAMALLIAFTLVVVVQVAIDLWFFNEPP
jgi:low temperature requirement protein LtrA